MQFRLVEEGDAVRAILDGQLNFASNEDFHRLLQSVAPMRKRRVVFDLAGVTHIDSVGLGLFYIAREDLSAAGATLALKSPRDNVSRLLELTEANQMFEILP